MAPVFVIVVMLAVWLVPAPGAADEPLPISAFYGRYVGETVSSSDGDVEPRDLGVSIGPSGGGFTITWETVKYDGAGDSKRKRYSIDFEKTERKGVFRSGMRTDMFGHRVPLDALSGDPFVWARISDATLTVYALLIRDDGGYEMQTYARTRTPTGLDLVFTRNRDGVAMRAIQGRLTRVE